jgi:hypothetical protein
VHQDLCTPACPQQLLAGPAGQLAPRASRTRAGAALTGGKLAAGATSGDGGYQCTPRTEAHLVRQLPKAWELRREHADAESGAAARTVGGEEGAGHGNG